MIVNGVTSHSLVTGYYQRWDCFPLVSKVETRTQVSADGETERRLYPSMRQYMVSGLCSCLWTESSAGSIQSGLFYPPVLKL